MASLFNGDNTDSEEELKINTDYANNYNTWRQKEELNKLKTKYGDACADLDASDDESSSSSSSEEETENTLQQQFDKEFYKTLACLKKKDPRIYNETTKFFMDTNKTFESKEAEKQEPKKKSKKEKALFLRDYERKIIVEREGKLSDDEDEEDTKSKAEAIKTPTYVEEQKLLKSSFKEALIDEEEEDTDLLKPKEKSEEERRQEEEAYKEWLKGQKTEIDPKEQEELKPLRDFWNNPNLDENEKFLRDYILNNKFREKETTDLDLEYNLVTHDSDENLSEDENNINKQEEFEHKYNFRFEEPDKEFIKRYPRTMENSMRRKDNRRAQKRAEVKKRKEEEKVRKQEELKQLKALKRKEIEEKIAKLKEITGNDDIRFDDSDLESDFDPEKHDRKMTEIFNEEYYALPEEDVKPEFPEIDEELDIEPTWDNYDPNEDKYNWADESQDGPHCEDSDFNMDADYDPSKNVQSELVEATRKKKRRRRSKFAEMIAKEKPKFDPNLHSSYQEYYDQYYSLDYEDMIGDLPCRFKYRKVVPNDYGLSVEEILMADDRELNKWCSLKKALRYKPESAELNDVQMYRQKAKNEMLKRKILKSLYTSPEETEETEKEEKQQPTTNEQNNEIKKKRKRNKKKKTTVLANELTTNNFGESQNEKEENLENKTNNTDMKKRKASEDRSEHSKRQKIDETVTQNSEKKGPEHGEATEVENKISVDRIANKKVHGTKQKQKIMKTKQKFSQRKTNKYTNPVLSLDAKRLKTYGINAKKFKKKLKYGNR